MAYTIKQILQDHWAHYVLAHLHEIPQYVIDTIDKMLDCRNPQRLGYHKYQCPDHPDQFIILPNTCKSPFCNSCGKKLTDKFVAKVEANFPKTPFHHICFTIPDSLRELFDKNRFLINGLFKAASLTVLSFYKEQKHLLPLIIAAVHTFGRKLNFNCHIHLLITAGGLVLENGQPTHRWKRCSYIPFVMLHKRYRTLVITLLKQAITKYLQQNPNCGELRVFNQPEVLEAFFEPLLEINWYVHDSKELPAEKFTIAYIVRYSKKPPIAESRILEYRQREDFGPNQYCVTFTCKPHDGPPIITTIRVEDFISLLIQHIMPPYFRQVRYYGALANRVRKELLPLVFTALNQEQQLIRLEAWRQRQIALTGIDPLACPICHKPMKLVEIAHYSKELGELQYYHPP